MNTTYLFPYKYKSIGWVLFCIGLLCGVLWACGVTPHIFNTAVMGFSEGNTISTNTSIQFGIFNNNIFDEIASTLLIIGAVLIVFSRQKYEDEYISKIRLDSLVWATYINYAILLFTILLVYDFSFFLILIFNMFTILIFFIIRFNWVMYKTKKMLNNEK